MSNYKKIISSAGIFALAVTMTISSSISTFALSGSVEAPVSNSSFTFCNWNNFYAVSDIESARQVSGDKAYFYATENTTTNVVNGKCVNNLVANYVPYIIGHKTTFDISQYAAVTNVKVLNVNPELLSTTCDGNDTVLRFKDGNTDKLSYNTNTGANDFDITSSQESDNVLKVTLKRKDSNYTGSNNVTLFVNEDSFGSFSAGYKSGTSTSAYTNVTVDIDKAVSTSKLTTTVKGICSVSNNTGNTMNNASQSQVNTSTNPTTAQNGSSKVYWRNNNGKNIQWNIKDGKVAGYGEKDFVNQEWEIGAVADFNSDSNDDIIWRNKKNGSNVIWLLDANGMYAGEMTAPTVPTSWGIAGANDWNADNKPDLLWRNKKTGENVVWFMGQNGYSFNNYAQLLTVPTEWYVGGTADFNSDSNPDILWRNKNTGDNVIWYMVNGTYRLINSKYVSAVPTDWTIIGANNYNSDSKPDILWRNYTTGENVIWYMNDNVNTNYSSLDNVSGDWTAVIKN